MAVLYDTSIADDEEIICTELICVRCGFRWIAVRPSRLPLRKIQCPCCEEKGYVIETGEDVESFLNDEDDDASIGREPSLN